MGKATGIEWADHTFNPWWGCVKVSPACDHCYAEAWDKRTGGAHWGPHAKYRYFGEKHWAEPLAWDRAAAAQGERRRVFCASMADVFDKAANPAEREQLWRLIRKTPNLDWMLLTKRPQNIGRELPSDWGDGWPNVWLGTTTENQEEADRRIPILLDVPARVRFISCEPLLGEIRLGKFGSSCLTWLPHGPDDEREQFIDWVICGGESGSKQSRPMHPQWARLLRDQTTAAGVAFLFKQWGDWLPGHHYTDALQEKDSSHEQSRYECAQWDGAAWDVGCTLAVDTYDEHALYRVGKKAAGRELDGRTHTEFPA